MKKYLKLLRIKHYIKNLLIFLPLFFRKNILNKEKIIIAIIGFIIFSFTSSIVYIINDIKDVEKDRKHPIKKNRPIASGSISKRNAIIIALILLLIIISMYIYVCKIGYNVIASIIFLLIYLTINILYSFGLKNKPIIDIVILASGFVLRVLYGGLIINVSISSWLYLTVFAISFYLGLGKRRNEYIKYQEQETRSVLKYYNKEFLDKNMYMFLSLAICFYSLWAREFENTLMIWTVPIIMILGMRYSFNIENENSEGDPTDIILKDKIMILLALIYLLFVCIIMYI